MRSYPSRHPPEFRDYAAVVACKQGKHPSGWKTVVALPGARPIAFDASCEIPTGEELGDLAMNRPESAVGYGVK